MGYSRVSPCPGRSAAWIWRPSRASGANWAPVSVKPWSAATTRPVPETRTARSAGDRSALILDRDFDRHRLVDLEPNGGQDCDNDEGEKRLLHASIIPTGR